ncbi:hypothetical protein Poli38472_002249 [Pythium oligandrum]|uniref:Transmembrane protein n=1 Tax=Pythium oligandrum TaxID=41045 RepID=A0A8K1CIY3_PYTOL|nr:hypothetical protein Poli38472_002249 [Pythium oligandrum]|eukprot:TMW63308.1 hypothetical protein Poli38472_002249 [Pythium oligandrum]
MESKRLSPPPMLQAGMAATDFDPYHSPENIDNYAHPANGGFDYDPNLYGSLRPGECPKFFSMECSGLLGATFSSVFSIYALLNLTAPLLASVLSPQEQLSVQRFTELPFCIAILIGLLSDCVPIFGLRRKAYVLIGLALNAIAIVVIAIVASNMETHNVPGNKKRIGSVVVVAIMIALSGVGCMFVNICVQARIVELSQREPLAIRGAIQSDYLIVRRVSTYITFIFTYFSVGTVPMAPNLALSTGLFISAGISLLPLPLIIFYWQEDYQSLSMTLAARSRICWKILQQKAVWRTFVFICFFVLFLNIRFTTPAVTVLVWAGAAKDNGFVTRTISEVMALIGVLLWRYVFLNRSWRWFFLLVPVLTVVPGIIVSALVSYDVVRDRYFYRAMMALSSIGDGIAVVSNLIPITEIVQEGSEGVMMAIVSTLQRLFSIFDNTNANGIFRANNFYNPADIMLDDTHARNAIFGTLMINYVLNACAAFGLLFLPRQKLDAQHMRMYGGFTKIASSAMVMVGVALLFYSIFLNVLTFIPSTACSPIVGGSGC